MRSCIVIGGKSRRIWSKYLHAHCCELALRTAAPYHSVLLARFQWRLIVPRYETTLLSTRGIGIVHGLSWKLVMALLTALCCGVLSQNHVAINEGSSCVVVNEESSHIVMSRDVSTSPCTPCCLCLVLCCLSWARFFSALSWCYITVIFSTLSWHIVVAPCYGAFSDCPVPHVRVLLAVAPCCVKLSRCFIVVSCR